MPDNLIAGLKTFLEEEYGGDNALMEQLVNEGQKPEYFIVSCIDSRCNPGMIFRPKPGTFLAHKAMGAIIRPYKQGTALAAALQFALTYNGVKKLIILGHTHCGAIEALVGGNDDPEITSFIDVAEKGLNKAKSCLGPDCAHNDLLRKTEKEVVLQSAENVKTYPSVAKALAENRLEIKPWIFDLSSGNLLEFDYSENRFLKLAGK